MTSLDLLPFTLCGPSSIFKSAPFSLPLLLWGWGHSQIPGFLSRTDFVTDTPGLIRGNAQA